MNQQQKRKVARSKQPVEVDGVYYHGPLCECWWCSAPPANLGRKYAKLGEQLA